MWEQIAGKVATGAALFDSGQAHLALPVLNEAIGLAEQYHATELLAKALCNRASCYQAFGQNAEALQEYDRALELAPYDPITVYNRGELLAYMGNLNDAKEALLRAVELDKTGTIRPRVLYTLEYYHIKHHLR